MAIGNVLKKAIRESGLNNSEIARRSGVPRPCVIRFMDEGDDCRGISLATAEKLTGFFGLKLVRDSSVIQPQPEPRPPTIASRVRAVLAENPAGLSREQIADLVENEGVGPRSIEAIVYKLRISGEIRHNKRTGLHRLAKGSAKR